MCCVYPHHTVAQQQKKRGANEVIFIMLLLRSSSSCCDDHLRRSQEKEKEVLERVMGGEQMQTPFGATQQCQVCNVCNQKVVKNRSNHGRNVFCSSRSGEQSPQLRNKLETLRAELRAEKNKELKQRSPFLEEAGSWDWARSAPEISKVSCACLNGANVFKFFRACKT